MDSFATVPPSSQRLRARFRYDSATAQGGRRYRCSVLFSFCLLVLFIFGGFSSLPCGESVLSSPAVVYFAQALTNATDTNNTNSTSSAVSTITTTINTTIVATTTSSAEDHNTTSILTTTIVSSPPPSLTASSPATTTPFAPSGGGGGNSTAGGGGGGGLSDTELLAAIIVPCVVVALVIVALLLYYIIFVRPRRLFEEEYGVSLVGKRGASIGPTEGFDGVGGRRKSVGPSSLLESFGLFSSTSSSGAGASSSASVGDGGRRRRSIFGSAAGDAEMTADHPFSFRDGGDADGSGNTAVAAPSVVLLPFVNNESIIGRGTVVSVGGVSCGLGGKAFSSSAPPTMPPKSYQRREALQQQNSTAARQPSASLPPTSSSSTTQHTHSPARANDSFLYNSARPLSSKERTAAKAILQYQLAVEEDEGCLEAVAKHASPVTVRDEYTRRAGEDEDEDEEDGGDGSSSPRASPSRSFPSAIVAKEHSKRFLLKSPSSAGYTDGGNNRGGGNTTNASSILLKELLKVSEAAESPNLSEKKRAKLQAREKLLRQQLMAVSAPIIGNNVRLRSSSLAPRTPRDADEYHYGALDDDDDDDGDEDEDADDGEEGSSARRRAPSAISSSSSPSRKNKKKREHAFLANTYSSARIPPSVILDRGDARMDDTEAEAAYFKARFVDGKSPQQALSAGISAFENNQRRQQEEERMVTAGRAAADGDAYGAQYEEAEEYDEEAEDDDGGYGEDGDDAEGEVARRRAMLMAGQIDDD